MPPLDGKDIQLRVDSKVQFFAYQKLRDAVTARKAKAKAKACSVVVLDSITGEVLALADCPSYVPDKRQNLTAMGSIACSAAPRLCFSVLPSLCSCPIWETTSWTAQQTISRRRLAWKWIAMHSSCCSTACSIRRNS
ncbi:hypothetical protein SAMN05444746_13629 [Variovorax sp. OK212]|nr:hypothetical protein SAMN05518853_13729 [Variovorax sp. OK202]SFE75174.1 hypothetical protein SAMN05444746_13629 [Variovorax sp. OK212]